VAEIVIDGKVAEVVATDDDLIEQVKKG